MSRLIVMNTHDASLMDKALKLDAEIVLMRDAVLFTNNKVDSNKTLKGHKVYALKQDVDKRGLMDRLLDDIELLDMGQFVDLLFSDKTVINL